MKVRLLPLAIAAAIAAPGVALADGPTVYGKFNVTYENSDLDYSSTLEYPQFDYTARVSDSADTWELNSNQSRIGVKGNEKISDNLGAFYQAEFGIDVDDGASKGNGETFSQRDIFVGLNGGWGAVQLGRFDTPTKKSQGKVDQFNDSLAGDIQNVIVGEVRASNMIQYSSPKLGNLVTLNAAFQPGEEYCFDGADADCQDGPAENFSASVVLESGMFYGAVSYDDGIAGFDTARLTGMVKLDVFELGAIYQTAEESEGDEPAEQDGYILSAGMNLGEANKIRFQYGYSELENGFVDGDLQDFTNDDLGGPFLFGAAYEAEVTQIAVGFDHKLSKQTKLYVNYIMLETEGSYDGVDEDSDTFTIEDTTENNRLQLGVVHDF